MSGSKKTPDAVVAAVATIVGSDGVRDVLPGDSIVICRSPGFRRAGREWEAVTVFASGGLAGAERDAVIAEPQLELIEIA